MGRSVVPISPRLDGPEVMPETRLTQRKTPGAVSDFVPPRKPTAEETGHRSRFYVSRKHSADGNSYRPGEPVSDAEFARQEALRPRRGIGLVRKVLCSHCRGSGKRSQMKNHREGCGCVGCLPCKLCKGSGETIERAEEEQVASSS